MPPPCLLPLVLTGRFADLTLPIDLPSLLRYSVYSLSFVKFGLVTPACRGLPGRLWFAGPLFSWPVTSSFSTITIIHTPTLSSEPKSGVQWIQRGLPSNAAALPLASPFVSHEIFAVTDVPCARESRMPSRTCCGPPMRSRNFACKRPGIRSAGEVNVMRSDGYGRTRRYCISS